MALAAILGDAEKRYHLLRFRLWYRDLTGDLQLTQLHSSFTMIYRHYPDACAESSGFFRIRYVLGIGACHELRLSPRPSGHLAVFRPSSSYVSWTWSFRIFSISTSRLGYHSMIGNSMFSLMGWLMYSEQPNLLLDRPNSTDVTMLNSYPTFHASCSNLVNSAI